MERTLQNETSYSNSPEDLFQRYYRRFCHFAFQFLNDEKAAEDVVQDAFVAFWKKRHTISEDPIIVKNYFYSSIRNACYNIHRHSKVQERFQKINEWQLSEDPQFLEAIIRAEVMSQVYEVIDTLPAACCQVFKLGYLEGLTNPKIAEKLGISINTVKTQKRRALVTLRTKLNPEILSLFLLFSGL